MKIAIIGYGKMGQEIEKFATLKGHEIHLIIDSNEDWDTDGTRLGECDVAVEFSTPQFAVSNINKCFAAGVPVVTGTTGWLDKMDCVKATCEASNQGLFYAPNYSIGVNLFFELNRFLAKLMSKYEDYEISIEETHHIAKVDSPSGTAITLANDLIHCLDRKEKWVQDDSTNPGEVGITSIRTENVPGTHVVKYESDEDVIQITHTAKNRKGFALGAIRAAEFMVGKKGVFSMKDLLTNNY